tara:strand:+ start:90 stop:263 length:174 start_codon:yes stop_codon:yes gene_type:complete
MKHRTKTYAKQNGAYKISHKPDAFYPKAVVLIVGKIGRSPDSCPANGPSHSKKNSGC